MQTLKHFSPLIMIVLAALLLVPARAQDTEAGRGVVRLGSGSGDADALLALVLPRLFDVDPVTGTLLDATASRRAVARTITPSLPADEVTLTLDSEREWSDGEPITAYDVLFSLLAHTETPQNPYFTSLEGIAGARVIDEYTIALRFAATDAEIAELPPDTPPATATCDDLARANVYLLRSETAKFREFVDQHAPEGESPSLDEWHDAYWDANLPTASSAIAEVTSGIYSAPRFDTELGRLVPTDGTGAALISRVSNGDVNSLIAGDINVLLDVPINQRAALRTLAPPETRNFQIADVPGREALIVLLNLASPKRPLPGIHPETGEILEQGQHPLFSDINVRRALQLAIDQNAIIDGVLQRSARPLASLFPPGSWAFDDSLTPPERNVEAAKQLLDEAGWIDNGVVRRCVGCQTAPEGTPLQFTLSGAFGYYEIADELTQQWAEIGAVAYAVDQDEYSVAGQTFDAYLTPAGGMQYDDADPDRTLMLTPAGDILDPNAPTPSALLNYGSYNNPQVTELLEQARTVPGCAPAERAAIYHQLERLLQQDLPFLSVAAPDEFHAAASNVLGFAPRTGDPLWNVESWVVSR